MVKPLYHAFRLWVQRSCLDFISSENSTKAFKYIRRKIRFLMRINMQGRSKPDTHCCITTSAIVVASWTGMGYASDHLVKLSITKKICTFCHSKIDVEVQNYPFDWSSYVVPVQSSSGTFLRSFTSSIAIIRLASLLDVFHWFAPIVAALNFLSSLLQSGLQYRKKQFFKLSEILDLERKAAILSYVNHWTPIFCTTLHFEHGMNSVGQLDCKWKCPANLVVYWKIP